jgi:1,4-dihydroxy-6-naphthoate synthase
MQLKLGFSPCPNDTFIFNAIVKGLISDPDLSFAVELADVEALNQSAIRKEADITKLSFGVVPEVSKHYQVLDAGAALGFGCGPLLVSRRPVTLNQLLQAKIAIPGFHTTANLLLSMVFPNFGTKIEYLFSEIEEAVLNGDVDMGLIIHENRFTYESKGLKKVLDLGEQWEKTYNLPVPLGCIAIRRDLDESTKHKVSNLIRKSVEMAFLEPEKTMPYVSEHAQAMDVEVMKQHIALYVNEFSVSLGEKGRNAVNEMFNISSKSGLTKEVVQPLFIDSNLL